jgi:hypothetical protein
MVRVGDAEHFLIDGGLSDGGPLPFRRQALIVARFIEYGGPIDQGSSRETLVRGVTDRRAPDTAVCSNTGSERPAACAPRGARRWGMRSLFLVFLAVVAALGPAIAAGAHAAESVEAVRAEATKLYRAKRYDAACKAFRKAAALAPADPAIAADLGLCLLKMNDFDPAIAETLHAIRLARPGGPRDDPKTRRNAYYNLKQLRRGDAVEVPKDATCGALALAQGCDRPVHACVYSETQAGAQQGENFVMVSLGLTAEKAKPACDDVADKFRVGHPPPCSETNPGIPVVTEQSHEPTTDKPTERTTIVLSSEEWFTGAAVEHGASDPKIRTCAVLLADACLGVVALGCDESGGGGKSTTSVHEILLAAPKP